MDCEHLIESRGYGKPVQDPSIELYPDVEVPERFAHENQGLVQLIGTGTAVAAIQCKGAVDRDIREALDSLVRSYRTRESSGLIYDDRPANAFAERIRKGLQQTISDMMEKLREQDVPFKVRDADILRVLVLLLRVAAACNNGRTRGRAFLHVTMTMAADMMSRVDKSAP